MHWYREGRFRNVYLHVVYMYDYEIQDHDSSEEISSSLEI